jgi:hypothetical protein
MMKAGDFFDVVPPKKHRVIAITDIIYKKFQPLMLMMYLELMMNLIELMVKLNLNIKPLLF